ncbi:hypothetical protein ILUMI_10449 [Ignelater luminosus]|uniref:Uncharacterized protein n=1 Tax=Ignelater luminosus TaxID=2038154 RepID=A0A8K0G8P3_IGNLU|nr:hypothetical protein ILUMI_10449 [Ignelater luminosus]
MHSGAVIIACSIIAIDLCYLLKITSPVRRKLFDNGSSPPSPEVLHVLPVKRTYQRREITPPRLTKSSSEKTSPMQTTLIHSTSPFQWTLQDIEYLQTPTKSEKDFESATPRSKKIHLIKSVRNTLLKGVQTGEIKSKIMENTAQFLKKTNTLFDILNSRLLKDENPYRRPLSVRNPKVENVLKESLQWVSEWKKPEP